MAGSLIVVITHILILQNKAARQWTAGIELPFEYQGGFRTAKADFTADVDEIQPYPSSAKL